MQKIIVRKPGGYERLEFSDAPDPSPAAGEVLIDVEAVGVNFADCITRMGLYASAKQFVGYPITPGFELAGTVAAVGKGVKDLEPGSIVMGVTLFDAYQSKVVLPRAQVFRVPYHWSVTQAAGFPAAFLTAWYALFELAHPRMDQNVLVHSAAGGVGQALVQLAKLAGCKVTGVVGGAHKVAAVEALGADCVIDKSSEDLWATAQLFAPDGYDVILDANGVETLGDSYANLARGGKLVVYGFHSMFRKGFGRAPWSRLVRGWFRTPRFNPLHMTQANRSVLAFNLSFMTERHDVLSRAMRQLLDWANDDRISPLPVKVFAFSDAAGAHRALDSGDTVGKLVLRLD
ncbi:MAG: medium chain dehydrogenase/reductase family protein [Proteobacteria bacterium]|nr:medium chain dehydrogenase/reductase family protein [Pseudomonadota bacterium]